MITAPQALALCDAEKHYHLVRHGGKFFCPDGFDPNSKQVTRHRRRTIEALIRAGELEVVPRNESGEPIKVKSPEVEI